MMKRKKLDVLKNKFDNRTKKTRIENFKSTNQITKKEKINKLTDRTSFPENKRHSQRKEKFVESVSISNENRVKVEDHLSDTLKVENRDDKRKETINNLEARQNKSIKKKKQLGKIKSLVDNPGNFEDNLIEDSLANDSPDGRDARTVFVGNVPVRYNKRKLLKLFQQKGYVERMWTRGAKPVSDKISKKTALVANLLPREHPPLVVYVLYKTAADASKALELNCTMFEDHRLRVTSSRLKSFPKDKGVFVGNIPLRASDDDLYDMFSKCGEIVTTRIVRDAITGVGKGFGYVNFRSSDAVELALKLNEERLNDRELRVQRLRSEKKMKKFRIIKETQRLKADLSIQKPKMKVNYLPRKKLSDKAQKKKKKSTTSELKKKILAKKLTNISKKKERKSD